MKTVIILPKKSMTRLLTSITNLTAIVQITFPTLTQKKETRCYSRETVSMTINSRKRPLLPHIGSMRSPLWVNQVIVRPKISSRCITCSFKISSVAKYSSICSNSHNSNNNNSNKFYSPNITLLELLA